MHGMDLHANRVYYDRHRPTPDGQLEWSFGSKFYQFIFGTVILIVYWVGCNKLRLTFPLHFSSESHMEPTLYMISKPYIYIQQHG